MPIPNLIDYLSRTHIAEGPIFKGSDAVNNDHLFKEAPPDIIHLADLDMMGMPLTKMQKLWEKSFIETERTLGKKPDLRSAAKTTYSVPPDLYRTIT